MTAPIHITRTPEQAPLSAQQQQFNSQIAHIAGQRALLQQWREAVDAYRQRHARDLLPLADQYHAQCLQLAELLDGMAEHKLSRAERAQLDDIIADMACELADNARDEAVRDAMKVLYNRYARADDSATDAATHAETEATAQEGFGIDLDSPEDILRHAEAQMQARQQEVEQARAAHQARRKKKPGAREQKQQQEAKQASQALREVYRKLASRLHPDREPAPDERERKTALMQQANRAYEAGNLLELLELQWQAEQIDPAKIASLNDERLQRYNRVLAEQLAELQRAVHDAERAFVHTFHHDPLRRYQPGKIGALLRRDIDALQSGITAMRHLARNLQTDPTELKRWLKDERQRQYE